MWRTEKGYERPHVQWIAYESSDLAPGRIPKTIALATGLEAVLGAYALGRANSRWEVLRALEPPQKGQRQVHLRIDGFEGDVVRIVVFVFPLTEDAYKVVRQEFAGFTSITE